MDLYLQFGYGMMDHCRSLVSAWGGGTVILSPRDLEPAQMRKLSIDLAEVGGEVLLDPQFYLPDADHGRLTSQSWWPASYASGIFWSGTELQTMLTALATENTTVGSSATILPGLFAPRVDDDWVARQAAVVQEAARQRIPNRLVTIALGADAMRSNADVDEVLAAADEWDAFGAYLVCEHPGGSQGSYLVQDATWLMNFVDLIAGLRLKGRQVVVGYCNHQSLAAASSSANAIASGTWMNVRSFPPGKFMEAAEDEIRQRATWYYCPQALSEYKLPMLDVAQRVGLLSHMAPAAALGSTYADVLFAGGQPSATGWTEPAAFRHYLQCLRSQVRGARRATFDDTVAVHEQQLDVADQLLATLHGSSIRGQMRDFRECLDASRAALAALKSTRGAMLRRQWSTL
jgi:hypothetical protein